MNNIIKTIDRGDVRVRILETLKRKILDQLCAYIRKLLSRKLRNVRKADITIIR
jgi:hypothetical protein